MLKIFEIAPGITLRCYPDSRFKQGALSLQLVRPMCREEAAMNALLGAVLLRGSEKYPDLRSITWRLDELYGASVGALVRRVGDWQTTGFYCGFMEDRFAMPGDRVLAPMFTLVRELLLHPLTENGAFLESFVESEKKNLISTIESQLNDKRAYASGKLMEQMCRGDSFGIPRLGYQEDVAAVTPKGLYDHYRGILKTSRVDLFYVGSAEPEAVAELAKGLLEGVERNYVNLPPQTPFHDAGGGEACECMDVAQGKLCMGFVTPVTLRDEGFVAMQLMNLVFGGGMTSKLFMTVREQMSLCYAIGSGYHGAKGILTVSAGIDFDKEQTVREQVLRLLECCARGEISPEELTAAKEAMLSSLRAVHDSPGAIENYYGSAALSGMPLTPEGYMQAVRDTTVAQVAQAARQVKLHSVFFLKGVASC